jgi:hypothetical protein
MAVGATVYLLSTLTLKTPAFCSNGVFVGSVHFSEQTAITFLNSINGLILVIKIQLVLCETAVESVEYIA